MLIYIYIYVSVIVVISFIVGLLISDFNIFIGLGLAFFALFFGNIYIDSRKYEDRKEYQCIEGNLYTVLDNNLINQDKKCKIYEGTIYQIEENGDLIKVD